MLDDEAVLALFPPVVAGGEGELLRIPRGAKESEVRRGFSPAEPRYIHYFA